MRALFLALTALPAVALSAPSVSVIALSPDHAIVRIDGPRYLLRAHEISLENAGLSAVARPGAVLEIVGRRLRAEPGHTVGGAYQVPAPTAVRIGPDDRGRYTTAGRINGVAVRFLVDMGSALVRLNAAQAARVGIDFRRVGTRMLVRTASGRATAYRLRLDQIQVGGIQLRGIPAMVVDGAEPVTALLGMSFLGRLRLRHEGRLLILAPIR